jgi:hypothetical protein
MTQQRRCHGIEAGEVLVEEGRRGRGNPASLGFDLVCAFETQPIAGPDSSDDNGQQQQHRCHGDLPENGLGPKKSERQLQKILAQKKRVDDARFEKSSRA